MRKKKILILAFLACMGLQGFAQNDNNKVTGYVLDKWGKPVVGALVTSADNPESKVATDKEGKFEIDAIKSEKLRITTSDESFQIVEAQTHMPMTIVMNLASQEVNIGYDVTQNLE